MTYLFLKFTNSICIFLTNLQMSNEIDTLVFKYYLKLQ